ncbi:MAG: hypothetical protein H0W49_02410 [Nitrospirales bacterium]|nr:hypothetical protein [Nitrospirales bacterium]MBA3964267.1 hypothetical protein [Nitrospirales bacterium]
MAQNDSLVENSDVCLGETGQHRKLHRHQTCQDFISNDPTPAARPHDRTLFFLTGLCERSELAGLPYFASEQSDKAGRGVIGFGYFCRNKRASPVGLPQKVKVLFEQPFSQFKGDRN